MFAKIMLILFFLTPIYVNAQNYSQFDSLYNYCMNHKLHNIEVTLTNYHKLKAILATDTNKLHKAKLYFLNFILTQISKDSINNKNSFNFNFIKTDSINDLGKLIKIARIITAKGNTEKSISLLNRALKLCKKKDSTIVYINTINVSLSEAYRKNFEYDKAIYLLYKVINSKNIKKRDLASAFSRLSAIYNECDTCCLHTCKDSVEKYSLLSLKLATEIKDTNLIALSQNELGYFYFKKKGNKKKAHYFFSQALKNYEEINSSEGYIAVLINLSNLYLEENRYKKALATILQGNDFYTFNTSENTCMRFFLQLAKIYAKTNNHYYAYEYLSLGRMIQEVLFKKKIKKRTYDLIAKYDLKLKQAEINQIKQKENKIKQEKLFISIVSFLIILILIFIIFNNRLKSKLQRQKEKNLELENKNLIWKNEYKRRELSYAMANIMKQNNLLAEIKKLLKNKDIDKAINIINLNTNVERNNLQVFLNKFKELYPDFFERIEKKHPHITKSEKYLSALLLLNLTSQEIADILCVALSTIHKSRQRLRKKLCLPKNSNLVQYLKTFT